MNSQKFLVDLVKLPNKMKVLVKKSPSLLRITHKERKKIVHM